MKRKLISICTLISIFLSSPLRAEDPLLDNKGKVDKLDWALTDVSMKKTATSMVLWGILLPISIAIISLVINSNPGDSTTSSDSSSSSTTTS